MTVFTQHKEVIYIPSGRPPRAGRPSLRGSFCAKEMSVSPHLTPPTQAGACASGDKLMNRDRKGGMSLSLI